MEITIFKEITTEGVITSIEENSAKYHVGFYADMNNAPERKLVKESAAEIGDIIKTLKTSRIAITKANTAEVNKEHDDIVARLEAANKPFTTLIDAYNVERKKILDAEKARKQAIEDAVKLEADHEFALLLNKTFEHDRAEAARIRADEIKVIEATQLALAIDQQKRLAEAQERDKVNAEAARMADVRHVRTINRAIFMSLTSAGLDKEQAKLATQALIDNKVPNTTINY